MKPKNKYNFLELLGSVGNRLNFYRNLHRYMIENEAFEEVWASADETLRDQLLALIEKRKTKELRSLINKNGNLPMDLWPHSRLLHEAQKRKIKNYSRLTSIELYEVLNEKTGND